MSKTPNVKPDVITEQTTALSTGLHGLIGMTKTKTGLKKIFADEHASKLLTETMSTFINVDMRFSVGMKAMGEILYNIIHKSDEKIQRMALDAICKVQGIPTVEFNARAPRQSFATALFYQFPDMQKQVENGKDTLGALRLSNYMHAYTTATQPSRRVNGATGGTAPDPAKPRSAKDLFNVLLAHATAREQQAILSAAQKARVDYQDWLPEEESDETPAPAGKPVPTPAPAGKPVPAPAPAGKKE